MKTRFVLLVLFTTIGICILSSSVSAQTSPTAKPSDSSLWDDEWSLSLPIGATPEDVLMRIDEKWATEKNWTNLNTDGHSNSGISIWKFTDRTGQAWIATAKVNPCRTQRGNTLVTLKIVKATTPVSPCRAAENSALRSVRLNTKPRERAFYY